jgi:hypothetical protein
MRRLRAVGTIVALGALVIGCGPGEPSNPAPLVPIPPPSAPTAVTAPAPQAAPEVILPAWRAARTAGAFSLTLTDQGRDPALVLRMTCRPDRTFTVESERLSHIDSEERLTLGVGGTVLALVATAMPDGAGVQAAGPIDVRLLGDIGVGHTISASYGAQTLGPLRSADRPLLAPFVLACRGYGAG